MVEILILSKITLCKLLVRVFILLSVCRFDANSAKSTVCESLSDNSFDEVCKDLETLLGSGTLLHFFKTVVIGRVELVDLDTSFTALFVPWYVSAVLLTSIVLLGITVLSLEFIFLLLQTSLTTQNKQE